MNAESRQETWALAIASAERKFTEIAVADGNLVTYQREAMFALQTVAKSEFLQKCSTESLRNAVINVAAVGLTINPAMKLAYLVPRKGVACLDISYIGLVKIATDSGGVLAVAAVPVRANDRFSYNGPFEAPVHIFDPFANETRRGEIIGVYVIAKLASGVTQIDAINREEIDKIRSMSQAKSGPWFDWFEEMVKKAAIKRASKLWPRTERLSKAEQILNEHQGNETTIDGTTGAVIQMPQPKSKSATIDAATGEIIESAPAARAEPVKETGNANGAAPDAVASQPMKPGQSNILKAKLKNSGLTEIGLEAAFPGKALEPKDGKELFAFGQFAAIVEWISKNAKG